MIYQKLSKIQQKLKAPKEQGGSGVKYKYRSAEQILEQVKPFLKEQGVCLVLFDDLVLVGERYYVKATARLVDDENEEMVESTSFAREALSKSFNDEAQVTGGASSYARKYALCGLFAIDNGKDIDRENEMNVDEKEAKKVIATPKEIKVLCDMTRELAKIMGSESTKAATNFIKSRCEVVISDEMTKKEVNTALEFVKNEIEKRKDEPK